MNARRFWNDSTMALKPYVPGEQIQGQKIIKLNTNENPYPPSSQVVKALENFDYDRLRLYPDPLSMSLRGSIADYYGLDPAMVFVGNGSDEILSFAFRAFFDRQRRPLVFPQISYSFYPVYANFFGLDYRSLPLADNYQLRLEDYCQPGQDVVLANPNAPTGLALSLEEIEKILAADRQRLVLVDEAYVDFGGESATPLLDSYDNLLIVQTFSKSRSLAGLRVGFALARPELIEGLIAIKDSVNSYPLDHLAQVAAQAAIEDGAYFEKTRQQIIDSRDWLSRQLDRLGFRVLPSQANFLFASHPDHEASQLQDQLRQQAILVRHFADPLIKDFLRISIGSRPELEILVDRLGKILDYS